MAKHRAELPFEIWMTKFIADMRMRNRIKYAPFVKSYCQEFEDALDGFVVHASACPNFGDSAISGSNCINLRQVTHWPVGLREARYG